MNCNYSYLNFEEKRIMVQKNFDRLTNHTIVCGYGRNGKQTVKELVSHNQVVLVIESNPGEVEEISAFPEVYYLIGDATRDDILQIAGFAYARAIITTLPKDADNLFVIITSKGMNPEIPIITRASELQSKKKMLNAGAKEVIMPDKLGGQRMAQLVTEPDLVEFIDYILLQAVDQVNIQEISIRHLSKSFVKKTIRELDIRNISGANIVGLKTKDNRYVLNPPADFKLDEASHVFALGTPRQISHLKDLILTGI